MRKLINISFLLDTKMKNLFDNKVKNDNRFKNNSDAITKLVKEYKKLNDYVVIENIDKKLFGFNVNKKTKEIINEIGNSNKFDNATQFIKKLINDYVSK